MSPRSRIHEGAWVNYDKGPIWGSTITLNSGKAVLLTNAIAVFIPIIGLQVWSILCYFIHQKRAARTQQSQLFLQQQVTLRGGRSHVMTAWELIELLWSSRKSIGSKAVLESLLLILMPFIVFVSFIVAAIFSSKVSSVNGDIVLLQSPDCGMWDQLPNATSFEQTRIFMATTRNITNQAEAYRERCYNATSYPPECHRFIKKDLTWSGGWADCPFPNTSICAADPIYMDTGYLNSHTDLGINAPPKDRILYRRKTTCSPLYILDYLRSRPGPLVNETMYDYVYGNINQRHPTQKMKVQRNYTFSLSDLSERAASVTSVSAVIARKPDIPDDFPLWIPIAGLHASDGDITIVNVAFNGLTFSEKSFDPMFPATTRYDNESEFWAPDWLSSVQACLDQHQVCNPNKKGSDRCNIFTGSNQISYNDSIGFNDQQKAAVSAFEYAIGVTTMGNGITSRRGALPLAQEKMLAEDMIGPIRPGWWHMEYFRWFDLSLAGLQYALMDFAAGPPVILPGYVRNDSMKDMYQRICDRQKIRNPGYVNFNTLGLVIIFTIGTVITIVNMFLQTLVRWWDMYRKSHPEREKKRREWQNQHRWRLLHAASLRVDSLDDSSTQVPGSLHLQKSGS